MTYENIELTVSVLLLLLSAIYLYAALSLPIGKMNLPGAGLFPTAVGMFLAFTVLVYVIQVLHGKHSKEGEEPFLNEEDLPRMMVMLVILTIYGAFFPFLGYLISSFVLILAVLYLLGMRSWLWIITVAVLVSAGSYYFFGEILKVPLPRGILVFLH